MISLPVSTRGRFPLRWHSGKTDTGPSPYQFGEPSEIVTGENAICPTTRPSTSATSENRERLGSTQRGNDELLRMIADCQSLERSAVTSAMALTSALVSLLISTLSVMYLNSSLDWPTSN